MKTKICFKCRKRKSINFFYRHSEMLDGHLGKCKTCAKKDAKTPEYLRRARARDKARYQNPIRHAQVLAYNRKAAKLYPGKKRARQAVHNAVRDGRLFRRPCIVCKNKKSEAHHLDYRKPLLIKWLCLEHHRKEHKKMELSIK